MLKLAQNLIYYSKKKGLTISSLARLSGVKQPTLHGWTTGRGVKNINDLKKISVVLEVGLHTLLFGVRDPYENDETSLFRQEFSGDIRIVIEKLQR